MIFKEEMIEKYFSIGLGQKEILAFLEIIHGIKISARSLKRILRKLGLFRRKQFTDIQIVGNFIQEQLEVSGRMHGYRWMHLKCLQQGFVVSQNVVRELLKLLDPEGVDTRRRKRLLRRRYYNKGPNYLWHVDSYDKLKPYGICINGCIDGFSRHIIWLTASRTSNDPKVFAGYYITSVKDLGGCPVTIRTDMGTENGIIEKFQNTLRELSDTNTQRPAFLYGRSTANQRIEAWWSILRKKKSQYWLNVFEILRDDGLFDGSFLDKSLIQYCFLDIIQHELDEVVFEWNTHKMQNSRNSNTLTGKPIVLFEMPSLYSAQNYLIEIPEVITSILKEECTYIEHCCDEDVLNMCNFLVTENGYIRNKDPYNAFQLYIQLRRNLTILLNN